MRGLSRGSVAICARLSIWNTPTVSARHSIVVDLVLLRDGGEVDLVALVLADQVDRVVQRAEHAEAEQVELHQPGRGAVVLVPLQHAAVLHPPPLDRADLDHRPVADHHPAGVDAEVARRVLDLARQLEHRRRDADGRSGLRAVAATPLHASICLLHASCWPGA